MKSLSEIKKNSQILEFIKQTETTLRQLSYTDHGLRHANIVADRARIIAKELGFSKADEELSGTAGFCHDIGNFLSRSHHNYLGAVIFHQIFINDFSPQELALIMRAISNHDKEEIIESNRLTNPITDSISAVVILADKSDVERSRVLVKDFNDIRADIHDRVNYAVKSNQLKINKIKKRITLSLKIDTNFVPVMEYFEIFTERMVFCRKAAEFLGYSFGLVINNFKLL